MRGAVGWGERHQVALCLAAIAVGLAGGLAVPGSGVLEQAVAPVLVLLLFATFSGVPLGALGAALRDRRFLVVLGVLDVVVVPLVVLGLSRIVADDAALLVGVLLVLLAPCVDYVVVFAGLAGGAADRLLAAAPLLLLGQVLLLPVYLVLFLGDDAAGLVDPGPFVAALVAFVLLPLGAAGVVQALARRSAAVKRLDAVVQGAVVPLLVATLAVVVASQVRAVGEQLSVLVRVVPVFVAFVVVMVPLGIAAARVAGLGVPSARALVFGGATRNSLVVLPLALALPAELALAPLVVVTQTLVELVAMVVLVRVLPRLVPTAPTATGVPPASD
ncbi:arsenic resistance protein [Frigoribacterium salinisoli]